MSRYQLAQVNVGIIKGPMDSPVMADFAANLDRINALADGFHRLARKDNTFPLLLRYKVQTERLYRRAVEEFERLKKLRPELPNEPILEVQPEENEPVSAPTDEPISTPQPNPEPPVNPTAPEDRAGKIPTRPAPPGHEEGCPNNNSL